MFSNGTEYHIFIDTFCCRCSKFGTDKEGIPYSNSCSIEKKISQAMFEAEKFPKDNVYFVKGQGYICNKFKDKEESRQYKKRNVQQIEGQIKLI